MLKTYLNKSCIIIIIIFICYSNTYANNDSLRYRKQVLTYSTLGAYSTTMYGLYNLWYKDYPKQSFHFFNDNNGWNYMDKLGHTTTSFHIGYAGINACRWAGYNEKKSIWFGGLSGLAFLSSVEIFDGLSKEWGFSTGDFYANTIGSALLISQKLLLNDIVITPKFSYHNTKYAQYYPDKLGSSLNERILKDYNGQTYWMSFNIKYFLANNKNSNFPKWLCLSIGYSANGMSTGYGNSPNWQFEEYKQFFISADIDFRKIKSKNKTINTIKNAIGFIKIPFPSIEFNRIDKTKFHPLYF